MADDDDWDTDPTFENLMTEADRRRAGSVALGRRGSAASVEDGARSAPTAGRALFRAESEGWTSLRTGAASSALTRIVSCEEDAAAQDVHRGQRGRRAPVAEVSCPGRTTAIFAC